MLQQRYIIHGKIGKGGMGAVYLGIDTRSGHRRVAIKEMSQSRLKDTAELQDAILRFQGEATMLRSLSHPNLPHVYDWFQEGDRAYLAMEFIDGKSLLELLHEQRGHPLAVEQTIHYAIQLCGVLDYLHQQPQPIIFRDLKPSNIMVTPKRHVYLIDFGIARHFKPGQTQDTTVFGTMGYAAPEQGNSQTTPRSDLYSLGAALHCCLTVQDPAKARNPFIFAPVRRYNRQVPLELELLIQRLVQVDEQLRPQSAGEVRQALINILHNVGMRTAGFSAGATSSSPPLYTPPAVNPTSAAAPTVSMQSRNSSQTSPQPTIQGSWWERFEKWVGDASEPPLKWYHETCQPYLKQQFDRLQKAISTHSPGWRVKLTTGYPPVWTGRFILLFTALLALTLGISRYAFTASSGSYPVVEFILSLLLLLATSLAMFAVHDPRSRSILFFTGLAAFFACLASQALPNVQQLTSVLLQHVTLNAALPVVLVLIALVPFFRRPVVSPTPYLAPAQPARLPTWIEHLPVTLLAFSSTLLLAVFGNTVRQLPLSSDMGTIVNSTVPYHLTLNQLLVGVLCVVALFPLLRFKREFEGVDRFVVCVSALVCALLQFSFGYVEIRHLLPVASAPLLINTLRLALVGILGVIALISLGRLRRKPNWWDRATTFACACVCASLQLNWQFLSTTQTPPDLSQIVTSSQPVLLVFGVATLVLFLRWVSRAEFNGVDRVAMFLVAIASALLQFSYSYQRDNPLDFISLNILLALGLSIFAFVLLFRLASKEFRWVDRLTVLGFTVTSALLQYNGTTLHWASFASGNTSGLPSQLLTLNGLIALALWFFAFVTLLRLTRPFNGFDRLTVIVGTLACALLPLTKESQVFQVSPAIQQATQHLAFRELALFGLGAATIASLFWLGRAFSTGDRLVLGMLFGAAAVCLCFGYFGKHDFLLPFALILLIQGVLAATRMERVRINTSP